MSFSLFCLLAGLATYQAPADKAARESTKPTAVLRLASIDRLLANGKYLADSAGHANDWVNVDDAVKNFFPNGIEGIDPKRPLGLYGSLDPDGSLADSTAVLLVPVSDEKAFVDLLKRFGLAIEKDGDVYSFTPPAVPIPVFFRVSQKYVYATVRDKKFIATDKLLKPTDVIPEGMSDDLSFSLYLERVPAAIKQLILGQLELQLSNTKDQEVAGESEAQRAGRKAGVKYMANLITRMIQEGSELGIHVKIDQKVKAIHADLSLGGKPGSALARDITALGNAQSIFAGLEGPDSALSLIAQIPWPQDIREVFMKAFKDGMDKAQAGATDAKQRELSDKLFKALQPSLNAATFGAALNIRCPRGAKHLTFVAGIEVRDGKQLEGVLRDILKESPQGKEEKLKLDIETVNGVAIHSIDIASGLDADARHALGDNPLYLALRNDGLFAGGGEAGLTALKEALGKAPGKADLLKLEFLLGNFAPFMKDKDGDKSAQAALKAFPKGSDGTDLMSLRVQGGSTFKLEFDLGVGWLRFAHEMEAQKD
jgi:hypothetical protein